MKFDLGKAIEILSATPPTLCSLLGEVSDDWTAGSGEGDAWGPFDVVGHLIHGEETDWIPRAQMILSLGETRTFVPFDRFAQFQRSKGKTLTDLLDEFADARKKNIATLRSWSLTERKLELKGLHPELGEVTLQQLLTTWVVHDLNHIRQIATSMARKYSDEVGPWNEYLSILQ